MTDRSEGPGEEHEMMVELAGMMVGNYFLLERLAQEGMVETYRARPTMRGGCDVLLRLFRPRFPDPSAFRAHFAAEVEKLWLCQHRHILPLLEFGNGDELLFTVTLFPECETLEQHLADQPEMSMEQALHLVTELCAVLQYAHGQEIVHGNLQPSSIFLHPDEGVLLTNFSVRRAYQEGEPFTAEIGEGNAAYTAPEQGLGIVSPTSDLYALGVLLFRLLTGVVPYREGTPEEVALKHASEPIPSLRALRPDLPEELELMVRVALSKSPDARFPNAAALANALLMLLAPEKAPTVQAVQPRRIVVRSRRTAASTPHIL